jgi:hypothetical protein
MDMFSRLNREKGAVCSNWGRESNTIRGRLDFKGGGSFCSATTTKALGRKKTRS